MLERIAIRSTRFVVVIALLYGLVPNFSAAASDPEAYLLTHQGNDFSGPSQISTLDLATGAVTDTVTLNLDGHTVTSYGFGLLPGTSTYFTGIGSSFYSVNATTGQLTLQGKTGVTGTLGESFTSTTTGFYELTASYANNHSSVASDLYSVGVNTGAATFVGHMITVPLGTSGGSDSASSLYLLNNNASAFSSQLYSVDTATGASTLIGDTGIKNMTSMIFVDGAYYGLGGIPGNAIYKVDPTTAAVTLVTTVHDFPGAFGQLAPVVSVPEPGSGSMLLMGLVLIGGLAYRRHKAA